MNKRRILLLIFVLAMSFMTFTSCKKNSGCKHTFQEATCLEPKKCTKCGITEGNALGHEWVDATCQAPKTCSRCGLTEGEKLEHNFIPATYERPSICSMCNKETGLSLIDGEVWNVLDNDITGKIDLPEVIGEATITWKSSDHNVLLDNGMQVAGEDGREVTLYATVTVNGKTFVNSYDIVLGEVVADKEMYDYAYKFYGAPLSNATSTNIDLLTMDYSGYSVMYESLNEEIVTSKGVVTQSTKVQTAIMNVYIIKDGIVVVYPTTITVVSFNAAQRFELLEPAIDQKIKDFQEGEIATLPVYNNEYDVELVWTANVPEFIMLGDELLTPFEKTDVRLKCVLKYGTESTTLFYEIYNVGGQITKEEYLQKILDYYCKIELKGSINHLHKEYNDELYLDYQERINSYGVLNLFKTVKPVVNQSYLIDVTRNDFVARFFGSGTLGTVYKPSVPQAILNERFYKGYQMPNTQNVLWIVVHESAMTVDGQTAEYLAKMQYRYAFETGGREASWNYQVDAYGIYQSFADNVICWHASDGTATPGTGNNNGIGIEMCVNQDGNYEGTLANNAKLVASLMLKYNLNLDNVKRHHDMDPKGKECPSYLIRTGRYEEFVEMIRMEYILQKYFSDAEVNFELSTDEYNNTEDVLKNLFREGINGLYYNLPVEVEKHVNFKVIAKISDKVYESNSTIKLLPDRKEEDNA